MKHLLILQSMTPRGVVKDLKVLYTLDNDEDLQKIIDAIDSIEDRGNPRSSRPVMVVEIDEKRIKELPERKRPKLVVGDVFNTVSLASNALGVSQAFLSRELNRAREDVESSHPFKTTTIRGVTLAYLDETTYGN